MKKTALYVRKIAMAYLVYGWPLLLGNAALEMWAGSPQVWWREALNIAAFCWILCAPVAPIWFLVDREQRERVMARICGLREGDERERAVTGEAARATLLFGLSLQVLLLVMSLVTVHLIWQPRAPAGQKKGLLQVGMSFSSKQHLDPSGVLVEREPWLGLKNLGAAPPLATPDEFSVGGYLLSPSAFSLLALLILLQLAAFKAFSIRRYEGAGA